MMRISTLLILLGCLSCRSAAVNQTQVAGPVQIQSFDAAATRSMFGKSPEAEELFGDMKWSEGPLVLPSGTVICSDAPNNRIMSWNGNGGEVWLKNAGMAADDYSSEPGSNGLILDQQNRLLLCQHGSRRIARMTASLDDPKPEYETVADRYKGKRFNSPNDLVVASDGSILFTDPPYGLPDREIGEIGIAGVFRVDPRGQVTLLTDDYDRPNGIGLSPDEKTLYINNSDRANFVLTATPILDENFTLGEPRTLIDGRDLVGKAAGSHDGLVVARDGRIFATAPGGVWFIEPDGTVLSKILTEGPTSNVALSPAEDWLYLTNHTRLIRVKLNK